MVFLEKLFDQSYYALWEQQHHMQGTSNKMMMQVLFLSKGILTAEDALTTNQQNRKREHT